MITKTSGGAWRMHVLVGLMIVSCHAVVFYNFFPTPATTSGSQSRPLFGPIILNEWRDLHQRPVTSKGWSPQKQEDQSTPPPRHWRFPAVDIWGSYPYRPAIPSDVGPVTEAAPDTTDAESDTKDEAASNAPARLSNLRMVRWLRPEYHIEWALTGMEGAVLLDQRIGADGRPIETTVARSSGSSQLDESAVRAANSWRYATPLWRSEPVEVSSQIEVRFNAFNYQFSRIDESQANAPQGRPGATQRTGVNNDERLLRRLIEQLQSLEAQSSEPPQAAELWSLRAVVREWGPVTDIQFADVGRPRAWTRYALKPEYRSGSPSGSVAIRWRLLRVTQENATSLWKIAIDDEGRVWGIKAEMIPLSHNAEGKS